MKSRLFIAFCIGIVIMGCQKDNQSVTPTTANSTSGLNSNQNSGQSPGLNSGQRSDFSSNTRYATDFGQYAPTTGSKFISLLDANAMIGSYLYSINAPKNDSDLRSFSVDADMLRAYLADSSVKNVKLVFAHTLAYINAGNKGLNAGYQSGALTIIIAGYDDKGKYIFHNGMVLDHMTPCPHSCPLGDAGSDFLY